MGETMTQARRDDLLNRVESLTPAHANLSLHEIEIAAHMLRTAIARTGMNDQEAMHAIGIKDPAQFARMVKGTERERFWIHQLLGREGAKPIRRELWVLDAQACGCTVERIVRIKESA